ncbi:MAG: TGS domain-containing protein [Deltaproteobacteria bacterium]|uniref:TGS domain-containing protein n=1 Tax=Candidatus Zymogenus saltonus TaxID=2844893 RepID=A0A9D8PRL0_9DELT|nr:TGS domain-containing protein [Candidatus Zymogenus saltonus]
MPANLTPEYLKAEESYKAAKDPEEKLRYLEMMLSTIPKHKGTDKMQADIKRRISKTKDLLEKKSGVKRYNPYKVEREGAGQIAVVGAPNSGKSAVVGRLTNAKCQVADYPFTTTKPIPGMMAYENVQVQLVDLPPVSVEYTEPIMVGMIRNTDGIVLVFDLSSDDPLRDIEEVREILFDHKLEIKGDPKTKFTPDGIAHLKAIFVGNKLDVEGAAEKLSLVRELYGGEFPVLGVSANNGAGLEDIRGKVFQMLDIIRVYTKSPGKKPDFSDPVTLKKGATVIDFASHIHKDFAKELKFARIWSKSANKYEGQKVNRDESLTDGDVIELHI